MTAACSYKEWDSLSHLLYLIPEKDQKFGFLPGIDIEITTLDIYGNYMFIGSNTAILYVIDRRRRTLLLKLKCGSRSDGISSVATGYSNDSFTVITGTRTGQIYTHRLKLINSILEVLDSVQTSVQSQSTIRSLQLAADCNTAYCGDETGDVTVIDCGSTMNSTVESSVILQESQPVVQLSLWTNILLVSTTASCLIYDITSKETTRMGSKPRKIHGDFGGCLHIGSGSDVTVFSVRPGLRLWRCAIDGTVSATHIYKELVRDSPVIKLQGEADFNAVEVLQQFGMMKLIDATTLLSWSEQSVAFIDISDAHSSSLIGISSMCNITDVACHDGDVYILGCGTTRRLHRLAKGPDSVQALEIVPEIPLEKNTPEPVPIEPKADDREAVVLPPIVKSKDLIELSLGMSTHSNDSSQNGSQDKEKENPKNMKAIEAKFASGLSSVKEKLTVSGDDVKQVGHTMKLGFGSFLNKVQNLSLPSKKQHLPQSEPEKPAVVSEIVANAKAASTESAESAINWAKEASSSYNSSDQNTMQHSQSPYDVLSAYGSPHSDSVPKVVVHHAGDKKSSESLDNPPHDDDDDSNFVIRLAPDKRSSFPGLPSSPDHSDSVKEFSLSCDESSVHRKMSLQYEPSQSASQTKAAPKKTLQDTMKAKTKEVVRKVKCGDEVDELMLRLNKLLDTKEVKEFNFLKNALHSEKTEDKTRNVASEAAVPRPEPVEVTIQSSDSEDDEEDIYKPRQVIHDDAGIHFEVPTAKVDDSKTYGVSGISKFAQHITSEQWTCESVMSQPVSICTASNYIWVQDKYSTVWVAKAEQCFLWKKLDIKAHSLSVAPSGALAWMVYKGTAYAGHCKTRPYTPWSMKWTVAVQGVSTVAVDENCAWYIKTNGEIWLQSNLSKDRPLKHGVRIPCKYSLVKIVSRNGVTWGLTKSGRIFYFSSNAGGNTSMSEWVSINDANNIADICLTPDGSKCWLIDSDGELWCMMGLSAQQAINSHEIWQVVYHEGWNAHNRHKALRLFTAQAISNSSASSPIISASADLVSISHAYSLEDINVSRTHSIGYRWMSVTLATFSSKVRWKAITYMTDHKMVAMYDTGELFYLELTSGIAVNINLPPAVSSHNLKIGQIHSCSLSLWLILMDGSVYYSTDIASSDSVKLGLNWRELNGFQFAQQSVKSLSIGQESAWAVDVSGTAFLSMGINIKKQSEGMNPAWIPVDEVAKGHCFRSVHVNDKNTMVWAVDTNNNVFVRKGVTTQLPIGTSWVQVSAGIQARDLSISDSLVWAISKESRLFCRVGITEDHFQGEFWKTVPSAVKEISVSPRDRVSGLTAAGELVSLTTRVIGEVKQREPANTCVDGDWELV